MFSPSALSASVTASSIERFVDGVVERSIVARETAGATVSIVANGRLVMAKGYGLADVERARPVAGRVTQFRIGSITKVLTWISVLQLVEAGKLDLDADVNTYLSDFSVPRDFSDSITLRHLMTHTPGFEDNLVDLFVTGPRQVGTLATTLAQTMPRRVAPPGVQVSYSNYGVGLAGHIVAQVSGMDWHDYVETSILRPLGMTDATTRQPVSETIEASRARGYTRPAEGFEEQGFVFVPLAPAGAATASALDMARLMVELLNPESTSVLSASSKTQLLSGAYVTHPEVNGMTLGMYEMSQGGARAVGHGGNTILFESLMVLWPEERLGLFVSTNTAGGGVLANALADTFAHELGLAGERPRLEGVDDARGYVGTYVSARRNHSNFTKLMALTNTVSIRFDEYESTLWVTDAGGPRPFKKLDRGLYQEVNGSERIVFQDGDTLRLYFSAQPVFAFTRVRTSESLPLNGTLLAIWLLLAVGVLILWPLSYVIGSRRARGRGQTMPVVLTILTILITLFFILQVANAAGGDGYHLLMHGFREVPDLLWFPVAVAGLVLMRLLYVYRVWADGFWWFSRRLHFSLMVLADVALVWWFWQWNLLPEQLLAFVK